MKTARRLTMAAFVLAFLNGSVQGEDYIYVTNNGSITITGYTGPRDAATIPSAINGLPVTAIGYDAFRFCPSLSSVTIPDSVISIGDWSFNGCQLTNLIIPNSVQSIGSGAFAECASLVSITIPNSVTSIGHHSFEDCISLTSVNIGQGLTNIGDYAFLACRSLTNITVAPSNSAYSSVTGVLFNKDQTTLIQYMLGKAGSYTIPTRVISIGPAAFLSCAGLTSVTIPNSVISIGKGAFQASYSLTRVSIGDNVTVIGDLAFAATSLASVVIPNSVTNLGADAFNGCTSLTNITIGNSVTSIGDEAFWNCSALTRVTIPNRVASIGNYAFAKCTGLRGIYFEGNAPTVGSAQTFLGVNATAYYLPWTSGWLDFWYLFRELWRPQLLSDASLGVRTNQYGFNITWASGMTVVMEASTNLANPAWSAVSTNTLTGGSSYFSDPQWTNYPTRFYRIRSL